MLSHNSKYSLAITTFIFAFISAFASHIVKKNNIQSFIQSSDDECFQTSTQCCSNGIILCTISDVTSPYYGQILHGQEYNSTCTIILYDCGY